MGGMSAGEQVTVIKKILLTTLLFLFLLGLLAFCLVIYFHFQRIADTNRWKLVRLESAIKQNEVRIREQAKIRLTAQGVFMSGECVPAPTCPTSGNYQTEIYVIPVSTLGISPRKSATQFSALAVGRFNDVNSPPTVANEVSDCGRMKLQPCTLSPRFNRNLNASTKFWRVCLYQGQQNKRANAKPNDEQFSQGMVAVFTQCKPVSIQSSDPSFSDLKE